VGTPPVHDSSPRPEPSRRRPCEMDPPHRDLAARLPVPTHSPAGPGSPNTVDTATRGVLLGLSKHLVRCHVCSARSLESVKPPPAGCRAGSLGSRRHAAATATPPRVASALIFLLPLCLFLEASARNCRPPSSASAPGTRIWLSAAERGSAYHRHSCPGTTSLAGFSGRPAARGRFVYCSRARLAKPSSRVNSGLQYG
jgi:hypothetical protein